MRFLHNILAFLDDKGVNRSLLVLLSAGLLLRLIIAPITSHPYDMAAFIARSEWAYVLHLNPLYHAREGLLGASSYLIGYPVYLVLSWFGFENVLALQLAIKLPYILADVGIAFLLHRICLAKTKNNGLSNLLAISWLVNPFVIFITSIHGQIDSLTILFTLLAVFFLVKDKPVYSFISLGIAGCLRYYPFFLFPLFLIYFWRKMGRKEIIISGAGLLVILAVNFLPVLLNPVLRSQLFHSFAFYSTGTVDLVFKPWSLWSYLDSVGVVEFFPHFVQTHLFWITFIPLYMLALILFYRSHTRLDLEKPSTVPITQVRNENHGNKGAYLNIFKYAAIILLLIPSLNPFSDPQFLLWALPFLLYLSVIGDKRLGILVSIVCVLNLLVIIFTFDTQPFRYLSNAYPAIRDTYFWPPMEYASIRFGYLYSLVVLVTIVAVLMRKSVSVAGTSGGVPVRDALVRNWGAIFTYVVILVFIFSTIMSLPSKAVSKRYLDSDYVYRQVFSFEPTEVITADEEGRGTYKFKIDVIPFMTDEAWRVTHAYIEFENLPESTAIDVNRQSIPYSAVAQRNIPYFAQIVDFIEIPDPRHNLMEETLLILQLPSNLGEFKEIVNGNFERGLKGWESWVPEETGIDAEMSTIPNLGSKSLVTRRAGTDGWVWVVQDVEAMERTDYKVEFWMRTQNARQAHFKISYQDSEGQTIKEDRFQAIDGNRDWWKVSSTITTPTKTASIRVYCMGGASLDGIEPGITWFDGVEISAIPFLIENLKATIVLDFDIDE